MPRSRKDRIKSQAARTTRGLSLEGLETRRLMAYDIDFDDGIITVEGGDAHDYVEIFYDGDEVVVEIKNAFGQVIEDYDRDLEDVLRIDVYLGAGNDSVVNNTSITMYAWGGSGNDVLSGGTGSDFLYGEADNDTLRGGEGDDYLDGGLGADSLFGGNHNDQLIGGANDDTYYFEAGHTGFDTIVEQTGGGIDTLNFQSLTTGIVIDLNLAGPQFLALNRSVTLTGELENLVGTEFSDILLGNSLANRLEGGEGHDYLGGRGGSDSLWGGSGNDLLNGGGGDDLIAGGSGDDQYLFNADDAGLDSIVEAPNADIDLISFSGLTQGVFFRMWSTSVQTITPTLSLQLNSGVGLENAFGTPYDDIIFGNARNNQINGNSGHDTLYGDVGNDVLIGGLGNDVLHGGAGNDTLQGDSGSDRYVFAKFGLGEDTISETLNSGDVNTLDFSQFGTGLQVSLNDGAVVVNNANLKLTVNDTNRLHNIIGSAYGDQLIGNGLDNLIQGGGGGDIILGVNGNDTLEGGDGDDFLYGGWGNDVLLGGKGDDWIYGDKGNDWLVGEEGFDRLFGEEGADLLWSMGGADELWGGSGDDRFDGELESFYWYHNLANPRPNTYRDFKVL